MSQDEQIKFKDEVATAASRHIPRKDDPSVKKPCFANFILSQRYPADLAWPDEAISARTGLKKTYL